jgi:hypothetical protein
MPIQIFEGVRDSEREQLQRRNLERRFYALAAAVRDHEARVRRTDGEVARHDEHLYRRLRQLCGEPATAEHGLS